MEKSVFLFSKNVFTEEFVKNITYDECQELTYSDYLTEKGYLMKFDCKDCSTEKDALSNSISTDDDINHYFVASFGFPKAYIITLEYRVDGGTMYEINDVYTDKTQAIDRLKKLSFTIKNDWTSNSDKWAIGNDEDDLFQYERNDWDDYYEVAIIERELK